MLFVYTHGWNWWNTAAVSSGSSRICSWASKKFALERGFEKGRDIADDSLVSILKTISSEPTFTMTMVLKESLRMLRWIQLSLLFGGHERISRSIRGFFLTCPVELPEFSDIMAVTV